MTFFVSVLALNVKRVELADLDDRQMSKRLRELAQCDPDVDRPPDYCPIQEPVTLDTAPKTCAECKHFKTHRTFNALMLCLVILALTLLQPSSRISRRHTEVGLHEQLSSLSNKFWASVNPQHHSMWLQINPPYLVTYTSDPQQHLEQAQFYEDYFATKKTTIQDEPVKQPARSRSRFRQFLYESVIRILCLLAIVNFPSILLCIALVIIIMWLTPPWRDQWLVPFLKAAFIEIINGIRYYLKRTIQMLPDSVSSKITSEKSEYDENGVHRGAISAQNQFNQLNKSHVDNVQIKTLSGKHTGDVHQLAVNAKHGTVVSCGQDGRIIMWDADQGEWMARLDRLRQTNSGLLEGDLNPLYWKAATKRHLLQRQPSGSRRQSKQMMPARCIKVDQGNKWIASAFDDGVIRVWDTTTGTIVRELRVETEIPVVMEDDPAQERSELRRRRQTATASHDIGSASTWNSTQRRVIDRVVAIQFVGAVAEYCHPLVAEAAARQRTTANASIEDNSSQNFLVSVHKSGTIREWNILSGECAQVISTGHDRDITTLHVVECKAPHRKLGVTWVFTASRDGVVKCWERRLVKNNCSSSNTSSSASSVGDDLSVNEDEQTTTGTAWTCLYSLNGHSGSPITALTTESPVGGMGALVTASANGAVKVWNFETGDAVCTLSRGKQRKESLSSSVFRKHSRYDEDEEDINEALDAHMGNQRGPISQVVVSRYCEVEQGPGLCRGCDTCFGNGFLIAACSPDDSVYVWRLERADGRHEGSCTLCSKDYHRKATINRQRTPMDEPLASEPVKAIGRRRRPSVSKVATRRVFRHIKPSRSFGTASSDGDMPGNIEDGLLDIEQLGGESDIALAPTFLGKIEQHGGRGIVFCNNMILAGVRKKLNSSPEAYPDKIHNEWEVWFASLQYYEAPPVDDDRIEPPSIPVDVFDLEKRATRTQKKPVREESQGLAASVWRTLAGKSMRTSKRGKKDEPSTASDDDMEENEEDMLGMDEADEMLPFSAVRHVVPLDGSGLGCDYGNFIKLVYLDDKCKRRRLFAMPEQVDANGVGRRLSSVSAASAASAATAATAAGAAMVSAGACGESCQCGSDGSSSSASPASCCGGVNKRNGRCCGGTGKQRDRSSHRGRTTKKIVLAAASSSAEAEYHTTTRLTPARSVAACTVGNAADCSVANCARAAECHLAPATSTSSSRLGRNWALS
ncbi:hypothetical protein BCR43DRAFT_487038 [Syncephalastrum racemosum]|uniref:WD40-repeat-containing domain protein n=1 Tax=Syncephalastrum racemosum TaxID=13706 RepID=A0A1X2HQ43_SYNRA|nr:hypothetical protein BCR43DRAFT_487038 [Syncephalastrum racemosum]